MQRNRWLCLAHFWVSIGVFVPAILLGAWQMLERSPLPAPLASPANYYASVTAHGTAMAYVITTFFAMGLGYVITETTLGQGIRGRAFAWLAWAICAAGAAAAIGTALLGRASVLYTFYPPLQGHPAYYLGVLAVVVGSWIWCALMVVNMAVFKRRHPPGQPVPLAMFAIVASAFLWFWTSLGVAAELVGCILPQAFGLVPLINPALARTLFSVTLHGIVYFWLMPAYIAYYTMVPRAAGGRLYSDTLGRLTFILFLVASLPVGIHHLLADPEHGSAWKFLQAMLTAAVVLPTLLTVFTIGASLEIAGRLRGGTGLLGWLPKLPWGEPIVLAAGCSLVMLGLGGFGGIVNMSYAMNSTVHNTQWVTAHFHLIFGGAVIIMYMAIAYELWPSLTGRPLPGKGLLRLQLGSWCAGMLLLTLPWHVTGLMGMPRRYASFDYADPFYGRMSGLVILSVLGGALVLASVLLFGALLLAGQFRSVPAGEGTRPHVRWSLSINPPHRVPNALNGFGMWNALLAVVMLLAYGFPILDLVARPAPGAPAVPVTVAGRER